MIEVIAGPIADLGTEIGLAGAPRAGLLAAVHSRSFTVIPERGAIELDTYSRETHNVRVVPAVSLIVVIGLWSEDAVVLRHREVLQHLVPVDPVAHQVAQGPVRMVRIGLIGASCWGAPARND